MTVNIIAVTKPEIEGINTAEEFICYTARVSNPTNQMNKETAPKLLNYLIKNAHWSPFEMISITMSIETTRDIGRQILRHRSFSFQEFSQRYADPTAMEFKLREARLQDANNRQNSIETDDEDLQIAWDLKQSIAIESAIDDYNWAIKNGIAKEQARVILPEGLTTTQMYMSGTLRSWIHYCALRCKNGTQKEHKEIAIECWNEIIKKFPSLENSIEL